jgi:hypothetical protein
VAQGELGIGVNFLHPSITSVGKNKYPFQDGKRGFEDSSVVRLPVKKFRANNLLSLLIYRDLNLYRMSFFLPE